MEPVKKELDVAEPGPSRSIRKTKASSASQWRLMWLRFCKHKLAVVASVVILVMYLIAAFADFVSPYRPDTSVADFTFAPPSTIRFRDVEGNFHFRPFVYGLKQVIDPVALRREFTVDTTQMYPVKFFVRGDSYKMLNLFESDLHLFGLESDRARIYIWGVDRLGRDVFTRVIFGRDLDTVGLVGVFVSLVLGVTIGGFSGYYGGRFDNLVMRLIELIRSIPDIPLWMALSAALPVSWPPVRTYFGVTLVLSMIAWTRMARVVRSKFLSLREEDFVMAARLLGATRLASSSVTWCRPF